MQCINSKKIASMPATPMYSYCQHTQVHELQHELDNAHTHYQQLLDRLVPRWRSDRAGLEVTPTLVTVTQLLQTPPPPATAVPAAVGAPATANSNSSSSTAVAASQFELLPISPPASPKQQAAAAAWAVLAPLGQGVLHKMPMAQRLRCSCLSALPQCLGCSRSRLPLPACLLSCWPECNNL